MQRFSFHFTILFLFSLLISGWALMGLMQYYHNHTTTQTEPLQVQVTPSTTPVHILSDGTTFDCTPQNKKLICISADKSTEIDCSSTAIPHNQIEYFC